MKNKVLATALVATALLAMPVASAQAKPQQRNPHPQRVVQVHKGNSDAALVLAGLTGALVALTATQVVTAPPPPPVRVVHRPVRHRHAYAPRYKRAPQRVVVNNYIYNY